MAEAQQRPLDLKFDLGPGRLMEMAAYASQDFDLADSGVDMFESSRDNFCMSSPTSASTLFLFISSFRNVSIIDIADSYCSEPAPHVFLMFSRLLLIQVRVDSISLRSSSDRSVLVRDIAANGPNGLPNMKSISPSKDSM